MTFSNLIARAIDRLLHPLNPSMKEIGWKPFGIGF